MQLAQNTGQPYGGASNARDFQPLTRNPQGGAAGAQQQNGDLQRPLDMEVLSSQDLRISVPPADGYSETAVMARTGEVKVAEAKSGNLDVVAIAVIIIIIFAVVTFVLHRRQKSGQKKPDEAAEGETVNAPEKTVKKPSEKSGKKSKKSKKRRK